MTIAHGIAGQTFSPRDRRVIRGTGGGDPPVLVINGITYTRTTENGVPVTDNGLPVYDDGSRFYARAA